MSVRVLDTVASISSSLVGPELRSFSSRTASNFLANDSGMKPRIAGIIFLVKRLVSRIAGRISFSTSLYRFRPRPSPDSTKVVALPYFFGMVPLITSLRVLGSRAVSLAPLMAP